MTILYYDFETNGVNTLECGILQMSIVNENGDILYDQYLYPYDNKIEATEIHGIDENKLKEKKAVKSNDFFKTLKTVIHNMFGSTEKIYWVAYNNFGFDQIVFEATLRRLDEEIPDNWLFVDLYPFIKEMYPTIKPNYKLKTVFEHLCGKDETIQYHSASDDTLCLYKMMKKIKNPQRLFEKYCRNALSNKNVMENSISNIQGYMPKYNYGKVGLEKIGDLYQIYKILNFENEKMKEYLKNDCKIYTDFYIRQKIQQLNIIHDLQSSKRKR